jgi:hypothetical protein
MRLTALAAEGGNAATLFLVDGRLRVPRWPASRPHPLQLSEEYCSCRDRSALVAAVPIS